MGQYTVHLTVVFSLTLVSATTVKTERCQVEKDEELTNNSSPLASCVCTSVGLFCGGFVCVC